MAHVGRPSGASIIMSTSACATSSPDGIGCRGAAHDGSPSTSFTENAVCCAWSACPDLPVVCLTVQQGGKPGAENRHARLDERGWETERWPKAPSYRARPRLYLFDVRRGAAIRLQSGVKRTPHRPPQSGAKDPGWVKTWR